MAEYDEDSQEYICIFASRYDRGSELSGRCQRRLSIRSIYLLNVSTLPFHRASSPSHSPAPATSRDILFHSSHSNNTDSRTSHIDSKASIMLMAVSLNDSAARAARGASGYDQAYYRGPRRETADDGRVCWWELRNGAVE